MKARVNSLLKHIGRRSDGLIENRRAFRKTSSDQEKFALSVEAVICEFSHPTIQEFVVEKVSFGRDEEC